MPTDKKRILLSVPENTYARLQAYKMKNGITSDAGACLQLITKQLDSLDGVEQMLDMVRRFTPDELLQISNLGLQEVKALADATKADSDGNA